MSSLNFDYSEKNYIPTQGYCYDLYPTNSKDILAKLINNLAQMSFPFIKQATNATYLGQQVKDLHPLNSLEFLSQNKDNKKNLKIIFDKNRCSSSFSNPCGKFYEFLKNKFIITFSKALQKSNESNGILTNLDSFCERTNLEKEKLLPLIEKEKWEDFVTSVILKMLDSSI